jgi:hypothetical protein
LVAPLSSTVSTTILRPLTPPAAFCAFTRALNPSAEFSNVEPARPPCEYTNPTVISFGVTPVVSSVCAAPGATNAATSAVVSTAIASARWRARRPRRLGCCRSVVVIARSPRLCAEYR